MKKHYKTSPFLAFNTFNELFKLSLQTTQMLSSSAEVISRRGDMMNQALAGKLSWYDPEFTMLWQEKAFANMEAITSMTKSLMRNKNLFHNSAAMLKAINLSTRPYHTKVTANAKRLKRK